MDREKLKEISKSLKSRSGFSVSFPRATRKETLVLDVISQLIGCSGQVYLYDTGVMDDCLDEEFQGVRGLLKKTGARYAIDTSAQDLAKHYLEFWGGGYRSKTNKRKFFSRGIVLFLVDDPMCVNFAAIFQNCEHAYHVDNIQSSLGRSRYTTAINFVVNNQSSIALFLYPGALLNTLHIVVGESVKEAIVDSAIKNCQFFR